MIGTYYKINVNGTDSNETNDYNDINKRWSNIANILEGRGGQAVLYKRSVHNLNIIPLLTNPDNWIVLDDFVISPWEVLAEIDAG